jgi:hypothetical protein
MSEPFSGIRVTELDMFLVASISACPRDSGAVQ